MNLLTIDTQKITFLSFYTGGGNADKFSHPETTEESLEKLQDIGKMFNKNGSFNPKCKKAEEYALCLTRDEKKEAALELFDLIVGKSKDILLFPKNKDDGFEMVANTPGKLGLEGMYRYGQLLLEAKRKKEAGKIFLEVVDAYPKKSAIRGGDIKEDCARLVLELKAYPQGKRQKYEKIYKKYRDESY